MKGSGKCETFKKFFIHTVHSWYFSYSLWTAVILRLIFGDFLLVGGLTNPNYSLLALLCWCHFYSIY